MSVYTSYSTNCTHKAMLNNRDITRASLLASGNMVETNTEHSKNFKGKREHSIGN